MKIKENQAPFCIVGSPIVTRSNHSRIFLNLFFQILAIEVPKNHLFIENQFLFFLSPSGEIFAPKKERLKLIVFPPSYLVYRQIWLNLLVDDLAKFGYRPDMKFLRKKLRILLYFGYLQGNCCRNSESKFFFF